MRLIATVATSLLALLRAVPLTSRDRPGASTDARPAHLVQVAHALARDTMPRLQAAGAFQLGADLRAGGDLVSAAR